MKHRLQIWVDGASSTVPLSGKIHVRDLQFQSRLLQKQGSQSLFASPSWSTRRWSSSSSQVGMPRHDQLGRKAKEKQADREFFIDLLSSTATKRDAKAYLSRIVSSTLIDNGQDSAAGRQFTASQHAVRPEPNLGGLFETPRAVEQRPIFSQYGKDMETRRQYDDKQVHHLALVKLVCPEELDDAVVQGIALTLSQLCRLGMIPCVVLECTASTGKLESLSDREQLRCQADRLAEAIHEGSEVSARILDNVYGQPGDSSSPRVFSRQQLMSPIRTGQIPITLPLAYSDTTQSMALISANQAILALTRELAGLNLHPRAEDDQGDILEQVKALQSQASLDRLIILDPEGGIPHPEGSSPNHVFLNLEQEHDQVYEQLLRHGQLTNSSWHARSKIAKGIAFSPSRHDVSQEVSAPAQAADEERGPIERDEQKNVMSSTIRHLGNLKLLRDILALLPPSSSAIVVSPLAAAKSSKTHDQTTSVSAVGTRTQKNPLIHNLLTDKPPYSASLPVARLGRPLGPTHGSLNLSTPTFVKKGMPLTIIPSPKIGPWSAENHGKSRVKLTDPRIDLSRLIHLINDSFNRKLDVEHYLHRVNDKIAGLVIAGEYEGGALFTWETPPHVSPADTSRQVPYLDKFAVLKRSQGAGGVADILFNAMVRGCFPKGVCWRSREDNPVNKWYFERARGTWKLAGTHWTMFWTTEGAEAGNGQRLQDYEAVCRGVEPSWADNRVAD